jgi:hypothetical protein
MGDGRGGEVEWGGRTAARRGEAATDERGVRRFDFFSASGWTYVSLSISVDGRERSHKFNVKGLNH